MNDDDFEFRLVSRHRVESEEILQNIKKFSEVKKKKRITGKEYNEWDNRIVSTGTVISRFGSWSNAIKKAGLTENLIYKYKLNPEEMINIFKDCCNEIGGLPSIKQLNNFLIKTKCSYSISSYIAYFGGLKRILNRIIEYEEGCLSKQDLLKRHNRSDSRLKIRSSYIKRSEALPKIDRKRRKFNKQDIIKILNEYYKINNYKSFSSKQFQRWTKKPISSVTIIDIFGSWPKALSSAGIKPKRALKRDPISMVELFEDCWRELKRAPSHKELDRFLSKKLSPYTSKSYTYHFGGIRRLAERIIKFHNGEISRAELYSKHNSKSYRKPISLKTRYKILRRDGNKCVKCGATADHAELEVDHIIPVAQGGDNSFNNLQTLCWECNRGKKDRFCD